MFVYFKTSEKNVYKQAVGEIALIFKLTRVKLTGPHVYYFYGSNPTYIRHDLHTMSIEVTSTHP